MRLEIKDYKGDAEFYYFDFFEENFLSEWVEFDKKKNKEFISLNPKWLYHWWDSYKETDFSLHIFSIYYNNKLGCVIPLMSNKNTLMFLSNNCSDYLGILFEKGTSYDLKVLFDFIFSSYSFNDLVLKNIREDIPFFDFVINYSKVLFNEIAVIKTDLSYFVKVNSDWEKYYSKLSYNLRRTIKKSQTKLMKSGFNYKFEVIKKYSPELLNELFEIHKTNWDNNFDASSFYDDRRRSFTHKICRTFANEKKLLIFCITINKKIVAYRFGFLVNKKYQDWNTSFSIEYSRYSIGTLLMYECIKFLFQFGYKEINFMRGNEYYKEKWAKSYRKSYSLTANKLENQLLFLRRKPATYLRPLKGFIFDLDGVVYKNEKPLIDSVNGINLLYKKGYKIGFLTNTSSKSRDQINSKLIEIGIIKKEHVIMTSAIATLDYLKENNINSCFLFGGGEALKSLIVSNKISIIKSMNKTPDCVLIGYSKDFNYDTLITIISYLEKGAILICTDKDYSFSHDNENLPGTGWYVESIEKVSRKKGIIIGKPNTFSLSKTLSNLNLQPSQTLMVGDNLYTDIVAAKKLKMPSCLLLGGVSTIGDVAAIANENKPEFVINSVNEIIKQLT